MKRFVLIIVAIFFCTFAYSQKYESSYGTHIVKQGETLYSIAKTYYLSVNDIVDVNKGLNKDNIKTGQTINIPKTVRNYSMFSNENEQVQPEINSEALFKNKTAKIKTEKKADKSRQLNIALLLPLFYENIGDLAFNQYNIDERRSKNYKCFSYIGFYEGARIALDNLEKQGYKVNLYVFDVGENDAAKMNKALKYPKMKEMDLLVPLVFKNSFDIVSKFSMQHSIPIVNPMSPNTDILSNKNVFKIQPDKMSLSVMLMDYLQSKYYKQHIIMVYDDKFVDNKIVNYWKENMPKVTDKWTILNYHKSAKKLAKQIDKTSTNIVINLTDKLSERENKSYAQEFLRKLSTLGSDIILFSQYEWINYVGNDYKQLQDLNFHFALSYYNDYTNQNFVRFVEQYRKNFKSEPDKIYAAIGYDIMTYFVPLLIERQADILSNPNTKNKNNMIMHYKFSRLNSEQGWQNRNATIYKMEDYKIKSEWSY